MSPKAPSRRRRKKKGKRSGAKPVQGRNANLPSKSGLLYDSVSFEDVTVSFTKEEWDLLDPKQRALYKEVMRENYENVCFLAPKPELISRMEQGEELWIPQAKAFEEMDNSNITKSNPVEDNWWKREVCIQCGMCFTYKLDLARHWRSHLVNECYTKGIPHKGALFRTRFAQKVGVLVQNRAHSAKKQSGCDASGKRSTSVSHLARCESIQGLQKQNQCQLCGKSFGSKALFVIHQIIHKGKKP